MFTFFLQIDLRFVNQLKTKNVSSTLKFHIVNSANEKNILRKCLPVDVCKFVTLDTPSPCPYGVSGEICPRALRPGCWRGVRASTRVRKSPQRSVFGPCARARVSTLQRCPIMAYNDLISDFARCVARSARGAMAWADRTIA